MFIKTGNRISLILICFGFVIDPILIEYIISSDFEDSFLLIAKTGIFWSKNDPLSISDHPYTKNIISFAESGMVFWLHLLLDTLSISRICVKFALVSCRTAAYRG